MTSVVRMQQEQWRYFVWTLYRLVHITAISMVLIHTKSNAVNLYKLSI